MSKKIIISSLFASAMFLLAAIPAYAGTSPLSGYAWSSNIGWISFNSGDGATVLLSTTTNPTDPGTLVGYAWSSNIGWVKFGGLSGQTVGGLTTSDASIDLSTGIVTGWARACAGTLSGNCSSMTSRTDGWDGWIELSGVNHLSGSGGVIIATSTGQFNGYAWGSDVVGWIDFTGVTATGLCPVGGCPNNSSADFTVTAGSPISLDSVSNIGPKTVNVTIVANSPYISDQTVNLSFGSFTGSSDLSVATTSSSVCNLTTSNTSCSIPVQISLNTASPSSQYNIPAIGTRNDSVFRSGNIVVNVTCNGGSCGGNLTAICPTTQINASLPNGGSYSVNTGDASVSGGTGPYKYNWSNGTGFTVFSNNPFATLDYSSLPGGMYNPQVEVKDTYNNNTATSPSCGSVTVNGGTSNVTIPVLYLGVRNTKCEGSTDSNDINRYCSTQTSVHPGGNAWVDYVWPSNLSSCTTTMETVSGNDIDGWGSGEPLSLTDLTYGHSPLANLKEGVYTLGFFCADSDNPGTPAYSNTVEIDVSSSTVTEK